MLTVSPEERITVEEALNHRFISLKGTVYFISNGPPLKELHTRFNNDTLKSFFEEKLWGILILPSENWLAEFYKETIKEIVI